MKSKFPRDVNPVRLRVRGCEISAGGVWGVAAVVAIIALWISASLFGF